MKCISQGFLKEADFLAVIWNKNFIQWMWSCTMWELVNQFMSSYCFCVRCKANVSRTGSQNKKKMNVGGREQGQTGTQRTNCDPWGWAGAHLGLPWLLSCSLWYEQPEIEAGDLHHRANVHLFGESEKLKEEVMKKL